MKAKPKPQPKRKRKPAPEIPPGTNALLSYDQIIAMTGFSRDTIRRMTRNNQFPQPDSPEGEPIRWKQSTFNKWVDEHYSRGGA